MALADGMIQFVGIWPNGKRSDCEHIHQPMDAMLLPIAEKSSVSGVIQLSGPIPTSRFCVDFNMAHQSRGRPCGKQWNGGILDFSHARASNQATGVVRAGDVFSHVIGSFYSARSHDAGQADISRALKEPHANADLQDVPVVGPGLADAGNGEGAARPDETRLVPQA